jgi:membrane protein insertase Oxa1/YidC/SpoIIIJ
MLAGMHLYWLHGNVLQVQETYIHHKLEAIRLVNEQLANPNTSSSDGVIGTIACLALAEVSRSQTIHP